MEFYLLSLAPAKNSIKQHFSFRIFLTDRYSITNMDKDVDMDTDKDTNHECSQISS